MHTFSAKYTFPISLGFSEVILKQEGVKPKDRHAMSTYDCIFKIKRGFPSIRKITEVSYSSSTFSLACSRSELILKL
jgi:hypothetical protein